MPCSCWWLCCARSRREPAAAPDALFEESDVRGDPRADRHRQKRAWYRARDAVWGEVVSCDSTAVYRGFDIGTDKVPLADRCGVPHHLIDVADPLDEYSAARYAREAAAAIRDITARGRLPILAGGTGLYYRALTRGFFPGPARDSALRARLERIADRKGPKYCTAGWAESIRLRRCAFSPATVSA